LSALLQVTRPHIAAQAAAYSFLGAYISAGAASLVGGATLLAALLVGLVVAFGFVINDYADAELDRLTKPERPIPTGMLSRPQAGAIALALGGIVLVGAIAAPGPLKPLAVFNLALAAAYSLQLKGTVLLGNIAMAFLNSSIVAFGALAADGLTPLVWQVTAMIFVYTLAQEVLYTVDDREGDARAGLCTTAVYFGVESTLWLFRSLIVVAAAVALLPLLSGAASPLYLLALLACTLLPIGLRILPLTARADPAAIRTACVTVKWVRLSSLVPLLLLPIVRI